MADSKISQLTPITGANILDSDEFIIARPNTFENFAVTRAEMFLDTPAITTSEVTTDAATVNGNITVTGTVDGRDVAADGSKLDGIEALADVTDTTNVTAAGALMDSELTSEASVKALDQGVSTTDSPDFAGLTVSGSTSLDSLSVDTDTLYVDSANNRVGIGTSSPNSNITLEVPSGETSEFRIGDSAGRDLIISRSSGIADIRVPNAGGDLTFSTGGSSERMRIDSSGRVGIGTSSPAAILGVGNNSGDVVYQDIASKRTQISTTIPENQAYQRAKITINTIRRAALVKVFWSATSGQGIGNQRGGEAVFNISRVSAGANVDPVYVLNGGDGGGASISIDQPTVSGNDVLFGFRAGTNGTGTNYGLDIEIELISRNPDNFIVSEVTGTTASTGASLEGSHVSYIAGSEAMRIDSSGNLLVGTTDPTVAGSSGGANTGLSFAQNGLLAVSRSASDVLRINRQSDDGILVNFYQDGTREGSISVSGTTISYNGGHLSRWTRLPDGTDDTHIYKGTVMTNLDEMCEWKDEQGDLEDNEQLNKTAVSTQEGDSNVAGLFVAWDEDDDWGDYYLAMTGDLVVRIAQDVTVQRGDLLESAGDGTAKPQDDDIVRSKTVAKVTSTNVSHTYPDGSYAVPCVVMAC